MEAEEATTPAPQQPRRRTRSSGSHNVRLRVLLAKSTPSEIDGVERAVTQLAQFAHWIASGAASPRRGVELRRALIHEGCDAPKDLVGLELDDLPATITKNIHKKKLLREAAAAFSPQTAQVPAP